MHTPDPDDLPAAVLDAALARLVDPDGATREAALAALIAAHPGHAAALTALADELCLVDRTLAAGSVDRLPEGQPSVDGHRIVEKLGEGAFGVVYLAEQLVPVRRAVALKVLRPGVGDATTLVRFDAERQFLARLHHPAIAQVYGAGLLACGRPWFALEHVPGEPIAAYCDRWRLSIAARIELFVRLCRGVQHAHDQGIVHRDLKPANVLVVETDGEPQPKIIDFGIARALQPTGLAAGPATEPGRVVGTPGYMSPEQADGRAADVDARTDVFSLGVMLYELLTGELPWGTRPLATDSEPVRPSQRVRTESSGSPGAAELRGSAPRRLATHLSGDLDWIVLKAIAREPERRFTTAADLAADLQRHLGGQPVLAGPPAFGYRLRKRLRRRRREFAMLGAVAVVAAIAFALVQGSHGRAAANRRDADAAVAALLARANDRTMIATPGSAVLRRALAEDALTFYDRFLRDTGSDPTAREGRARTLVTLSQVQWLLAEYGPAAATAGEAVAACEALLTAAPDAVGLRRLLACALRNQGRAVFSGGGIAAARPLFRRAVAEFERCHAAEPGATAGLLVLALIELSSTSQGEVEGHEPALLQRARELQEAIVAADPAVDEIDTLVTILVDQVMEPRPADQANVATGLLQRAAELVAACPQLPLRSQSEVELAAGHHAASIGDTAAASAHLERAIHLLLEELARDPTRASLYVRVSQLYGNLFSLPADGAEEPRRRARMADALQWAESWHVRFPDEPAAVDFQIQLAKSLAFGALALGTREGVAPVADAIRRATRLGTALPAAQPDRARDMAQCSGLAALVADALDLPDVDAAWAAAASALRAWWTQDPLDPQMASTSMLLAVRCARHCVMVARDADAEAMLVRCDAIVDAHGADLEDVRRYEPHAARVRARVALRRGDWQGAEGAAEAAVAKAIDVHGRVEAAAALYEVWLAVRSQSMSEAERCRARATAVGTQVAQELAADPARQTDDPWIAVPLLQNEIRLACMHADAGHAVDAVALRRALDGLGRWRSVAHASEWDAAVFAAGEALLAHGRDATPVRR